MLKVKSKFVINKALIKRLDTAAVTSTEQTVEVLNKDVLQAQVIPRDKGTLQNESTFVDYSQSENGKVSIVSSTPYAKRLYYHPEYNFNTSENPNAKGHWFEDWIRGGKKAGFVPKAFRRFYRRNGGLK